MKLKNLGKIESEKTQDIIHWVRAIVGVIICFILMINGVVAQGINITPSAVSFNTFAGETKNYTFDVDSDGDYLVFFNSSNEFIEIIPSNMTITKLTKEINLSFVISALAPVGILTAETSPTIYVPSDYTSSPIIIRSSGGGSRIVYKNNTINNTIYVEVPKEVIKEVIKEVNLTSPKEEITALDQGSSKIWVFVTVILTVLAVMIICSIIVYFLNKRKVNLNFKV